MKYIISILLFTLMDFSASAQYFYQFAAEGDQYFHKMRICTETESSVVDSTFVTVDYRLTRKQHDGSFAWTIIQNQCGKQISKQTDMWLYCLQRHDNNFGYLKKEELTILKEQLVKMGNAPSNLFVEMTYNIGRNEYTTICGDYFSENEPWQYEDRMNNKDWILSDEQKQICGYPCFQAQITFRGRLWQVWYAPDIPISLGPWKLKGLPGLILQAEDADKEFVFECQRIIQSQIPIYHNTYKNAHKISRQKYRKFELACYEHPYIVASEAATSLVRVCNGLGGHTILTDENWTIPYNPIELE